METWMILAVVAILFMLGLVFLVRSIIGLFQRRWGTALLRLASAAAFFVLAGMILPMLARPVPSLFVRKISFEIESLAIRSPVSGSNAKSRY